MKVGIDDFGTGYSSLSYLKRFPVDMLKIDKSFVSGLGQNLEDTAIVKAIITLGHSLGLQITAEGVETVEQLEALAELDCEFCQGYYFARPLSRTKSNEMLVENITWEMPSRRRLPPAR